LRCGFGLFLGRGIGLRDQLHVEDEIGFGRDDRRMSRIAVGELVRDIETPFAADAHTLEARIPARYDPAGAVGKDDRFGARMIVGRVELRAVGKPPGITHGVVLARFGKLSGPDLNIHVAESVEILWRTGDGGNVGRIIGEL
jgi:hypothetical protein